MNQNINLQNIKFWIPTYSKKTKHLLSKKLTNAIKHGYDFSYMLELDDNDTYIIFTQNVYEVECKEQFCRIVLDPYTIGKAYGVNILYIDNQVKYRKMLGSKGFKRLKFFREEITNALLKAKNFKEVKKVLLNFFKSI